MADRPYIHVGDYGDSGSGKSTFVSTFPKPLLVMMFDPIGKDAPYLKRWTHAEVLPGTDAFGTPFVEVRKAGLLMVRLEYYHDKILPRSASKIVVGQQAAKRVQYRRDMILERPCAYERFLSRMTQLDADLAAWGVQTVAVDSATFMELAARKFDQYHLNPSSLEPRQWFAGSTDMMEEVLMVTFGSLPINVVVTAHIDKDKEQVNEDRVRQLAMPAFPGRMKSRLGAGYSELYRQYVQVDKDGRWYCLQTQADGMYTAGTQVNAPNPTVLTPQAGYEALWENWDAGVLE